MKFRSKLANLEDAGLSKWLLDSVFKNMAQNISGIPFVTLRALNRVIEGGSLLSSTNVIVCSIFISLFLVGFSIHKMVVGAVYEQREKSHQVSWEKIVAMKGVRKRHKMNGFFTTVAGALGGLLFYVLNSENRENGGEDEINAVVLVCGTIGGFCISTAIISEITTFVRAGREEEEGRESDRHEIIATEVADFWVKAAVVFMASYALIFLAFALDPWRNSVSYGLFPIPISILYYWTSVILQPLRNETKDVRFLRIQFFAGSILSDFLMFAIVMGRGLTTAAIIGMLRIPLYFLIYRITIKFRNDIVAKLPTYDLSKFLVHEIFAKGAGCLTTMGFLYFEVIACRTENGNTQEELCLNTSISAVFLSIFILISAFASFFVHGVPRSVKNEVIITKERMASMHIDFWIPMSPKLWPY